MNMFHNPLTMTMGVAASPVHVVRALSDASILTEIIKQEVETLRQNAADYTKGDNPRVLPGWHLVIFVHGFNNKAKSIKKRNNRIDEALGTDKVVTTWFNWECKASRFNLKKQYKGDKEAAIALAKYFVQFLTLVRKQEIFENVQIDIIAHSMGCQLLCEAIKQCKPGTFCKCSIVCMAADVAADEYKKRVEKLEGIMEKSKPACCWSHFWCTEDWALKASNKVNSTDDRAGQCALKDSPVNSVPCKAKWKDMANHGYIDAILESTDPYYKELKANMLKHLRIKE